MHIISYAEFLELQRRNELAERSVSASLGQFLLLLVAISFGLNWQNITLIKIAVIFLLGTVCVVRFLIGKRKILSNKNPNWYFIFNSVLLCNGLLWSILLYFIQSQSIKLSHDATLAYFILAGIASAAAYSISISKSSFLTFQISILLPAALIVAFGDSALHVAFPIIITLYFLFLYKQREVYESEWTKMAYTQFTLQKTVDSLPGGLCLIQNDQIQLCNHQLSNWLETDTKQILKTSILKWKFLEPLKEQLDIFQTHEKASDTLEIKLALNNSQVSYYLLILQKLSSANEFVLFLMNIDNLKRAQQDLAKNKEQLESSAKMAALGEMSSSIAHEINNPLAIISLKCQHLLLELEKDINKDLFKSSLDSIIQTTTRIARIIKGLRAYAHDNENEELTKLSLKKILDDTLPFCETRFVGNNVKLKLTNIDLLPEFEGRSIQLSQVFINLLNNAFDAIKDLPDKWIHIDAQTFGNKVMITVTDSGHGIPLAFREKLMTPFFTQLFPASN